VGVGAWDERVASFVDGHRTDTLTDLAKLVTDAGTSPAVLAIGALACVLVVLWKRWYRAGVAAALAYVVASLVVHVLKPAFGRPRPPGHLVVVWAGGPSFPSTHATTTSALAAAVLLSAVWATRRQFLVAAAVLSVLVVFVGACMVYIGAHWVTDVLAGWALGLVIGSVVGVILRPRAGEQTERKRSATVGRA
jgi:membrane-associated phospholipid phosphatase